MNENPKIGSTVMTFQVEIVPMHTWYEMRPTADGVEIVNPDSDPEYVSRENLDTRSVAEGLEGWLKEHDFNSMWTVRAVTPPERVGANPRSAEDLAVAAEVANADYSVAAGTAKMIEGALSGILGMLDALEARPTVEEIYGMYQKSMPRMLAAPGGPETLQIMACALLAQRTAGIKP